MKNYMEEFMKDNGLEINQEFKTNIYRKGFYFDEYYKLHDTYGVCCDEIVTSLLSGSLRIEEIKYKPILNEKERGYIGAVIKPFKDKVKYIVKTLDHRNNYHYIAIGIKEDNVITLPNFKSNSMYKDMEFEKRYTLEELRLK